MSLTEVNSEYVSATVSLVLLTVYFYGCFDCLVPQNVRVAFFNLLWRFDSSKMEEELVRSLCRWCAQVLWESWQLCSWGGNSHSNETVDPQNSPSGRCLLR